jgi:hypothetical protein
MDLGRERGPKPITVSHSQQQRSDRQQHPAPCASVHDIYEDIKATLRVSVINLPFSLWANHPALLELLWNRLRPNLQTRYVEAAADRIRERAVRSIAAHFRPRDLDHSALSDCTRDVAQLSRFPVDIHHYANPKLLIATAGLLEALHGHDFEPVKDRALCASVPGGIPAAMPNLRFDAPLAAESQAAAILKEIQDTLALPQLSSEYFYLSSFSGVLEAVWAELKPMIKSDTYWQLAEDLGWLAGLLARGLPFPISIGREEFKNIGMSVLEVSNWIIPSHMALTKLILNMAALKIRLDGKEEALRSPYPISDSSRISRAAASGERKRVPL